MCLGSFSFRLVDFYEMRMNSEGIKSLAIISIWPVVSSLHIVPHCLAKKKEKRNQIFFWNVFYIKQRKQNDNKAAELGEHKFGSPLKYFFHSRWKYHLGRVLDCHVHPSWEKYLQISPINLDFFEEIVKHYLKIKLKGDIRLM